MVILAIMLIALGVAVGLLGYQLFRVLLPIAGLVAGAVIGFTGVQGIFGTGVTSTTVAVVVAVVFALVMALLSYLFFDLAVTVFLGVVFASLFTLVGVAFGLQENGFVITLLSISGFIIGLLAAMSSALTSINLVALVTGFLGTGYILAGVLLIAGGIDVDTVFNQGVIRTVAEQVDSSIIWVFVWVAGGILFSYSQLASLRYELFPELHYKES